MDTEKAETSAIDIDIIDTVDHSDVIVIPDETERTDPEYIREAIPVSEDNALKTGSIIAQVFNLISQFRNKEYWKLDEKETKSLNKVCPKILPNIISEHSGLVTCILNILSIIIKRLKTERDDNERERPLKIELERPDQAEESQSLIGGRTS